MIVYIFFFFACIRQQNLKFSLCNIPTKNIFNILARYSEITYRDKALIIKLFVQKARISTCPKMPELSCIKHAAISQRVLLDKRRYCFTAEARYDTCIM